MRHCKVRPVPTLSRESNPQDAEQLCKFPFKVGDCFVPYNDVIINY
jgi:hypothetical protein